MHVRIVSPEFDRLGGTERATWYLAQHLSRAGASVRVLAQSSREPPPRGVTVTTTPRRGFRGFGRVASIRRAAAREEAPKGEVRYATGIDDPSADVVTWHACAAAWLREMPGVRLEVRKVARDLAARAYFKWIATLEPAIIARARTGRTILFAVSPKLVAHIRSAYGDDVPVRLAPNGVDGDVFNMCVAKARRDEARSLLGATADECVIGFVGGDWRRKRVRDVIEVISALRRSGRKVSGVLLGNGRRDDLDLPMDGIRVFPHTADISGFLAGVDVYLSLSEIESFGLPPLEAMAMGIPTVITRKAGLADYLSEDEAVLLRSADAQREARHVVEALACDEERRRRLGLQGAAAAARLTWDVGAAAIASAIQEVARKRPVSDGPA